MSEFYTNVKVIGNNVCYRGVKDGKKLKYKLEFSPKVYINSKNHSEYKTLNGEYVEEFSPGNIKETKEFMSKYEDVQGFNVFGNTNFDVQFIAETFSDEIVWDKDQISIWSLDIETSSEYGFPNIETANEQVLLITVMENSTKMITTFGYKHYENKDNVNYIRCNDEKSMLYAFLDFWERNTPDVITGWNINLFDIPYLINRMIRVFAPSDTSYKKISPWGLITQRNVLTKGGKEQMAFNIAGVAILDYLDLYKKFTYTTQESYKLDHIAEVELGEKKLDHSEFDSFKEFYTKDWNKFVDYNIIDVVLIDKLEDKMKLIELCFTMAYDAKINYDDVYSQVKMWDSIIYNHLKTNNIVIPKKKSSGKSEQFEGAYVRDPILGGHKWVVSFDATSLYPSIMQTLNISPETFSGMLDGVFVSSLMERKVETPNTEYAIGANGALFKTDKIGFYGEIIDLYMKKRREAKNEMLRLESVLEKVKKEKKDTGSTNLNLSPLELKDLENSLNKQISTYNNKQMAFKIALNSLYGASGNVHFRYFDLEIARAITLTGQFIIQSVEHGVNSALNKLFNTENYVYVLYCDTDSVYIRLEPLVEKYCSGKTTEQIIKIMDKFCSEKLTSIINDICEDFQKYIGAFRHNISFKREVLADKGIWTAKKRYILNVHNSEGVQYAQPKLKVMGLEMIKSSTPNYIRDKMKETVKKIINENEEAVHEYVASVKKEFLTLDPSLVAFPRSMNGIEKYRDTTTIYKKGTPIQVKGALLYNKLLRDKGIESKYQKIIDGDKIKFAYLKTPNPLNDTVISFHQELPKEFDLHKFIDYNKQFQTSYIDPMNIILNSIGWTHEKVISIEDFF